MVDAARTCSETMCSIAPNLSAAEQGAVALHTGTLVQALANPRTTKLQLLSSLGFGGDTPPLSASQRTEYIGQVIGLMDGSGAPLRHGTVHLGEAQQATLEGAVRTLLADARPQVRNIARDILENAGMDPTPAAAAPPPGLMHTPATPFRPTP